MGKQVVFGLPPVFTHNIKNKKKELEWYKPLLDYERISAITTGKGAKVAILDQGIDRKHKYLIGKIKHVFEFTDENFETGFHATHVGGIISSRKHGIFKDVELGCFKVLSTKNGFGLSKWITRGIRGAKIKGYEVINASLSADVNDTAIEKEVKIFCTDQKCFFVCASGNDGEKTDYPAALSRTVRGIISVGATEIKNGEIQIAAFSSFGDITIVAPGVDILSTLPEDDEGYLSGTSMAAPFVSGLIAVSKKIYPQFDHDTFDFVAEKCTKKFEDSKKYGKGFVQMAEFLEMVQKIAQGELQVPKTELKKEKTNCITKLKQLFNL